MQQQEQRQAIDRFLADNPELEQLQARLATFNVFRALKIDEVEIRHSNTLAWLLDPSESHGLGDIFLRRILSNMLLESNAKIGGLSAAQVELMALRDVEVKREWKNTDVLVVIRSKPNVVLLIENKIRSGEGQDQLTRYRTLTQKLKHLANILLHHQDTPAVIYASTAKNAQQIQEHVQHKLQRPILPSAVETCKGHADLC